MASINGVTIRGLKKFYGHDGETLYQGNVYYNGKKARLLVAGFIQRKR